MKIYTEVIFKWCDKSQKLIEVSSTTEEYSGPVALCGGGSDDPDYSAQMATLRKQAGDVRDRRGDIRSYFAEIGSLGRDSYNIGQESFDQQNKTSLDTFLADSYSVDKANEQTIRTSGFETNTELDAGMQQVDDSRATSYLNEKSSRGIDRKASKVDYATSKVEQGKAYEDQMDQIEDMLYQIETEYENLRDQ